MEHTFPGSIMIKAAMAILLLSALDMFAQTSQSKGAGAAPVPQWRRDAVKFREELTRYQKTATGDKKFPNTSFNFMGGGGVVPREWEVMQLYGGEVEWEGTFEGFEEKGNLKGRSNRIKLANYGMMLHLYPSNASLSRWQALSPGSKVRYRGNVEGIAGFSVKEDFVMMIVSVKDAVLLPEK